MTQQSAVQVAACPIVRRHLSSLQPWSVYLFSMIQAIRSGAAVQAVTYLTLTFDVIDH